MNDLISRPADMTMSNREIAELTGKRHDNVMRDIRVMLAELYGEGGCSVLSTPTPTRRTARLSTTHAGEDSSRQRGLPSFGDTPSTHFA